MTFIAVRCAHCQSDQIVKRDKTEIHPVWDRRRRQRTALRDLRQLLQDQRFHFDTLSAWWCGLRAQEQAEIDRVQLTMDNGSASSGVRTPFLHRMVQCVDRIGKPIQLLERCWGIMERHPLLPKWDILIRPVGAD